jgi:hypothetical protein
MRGKNTICDGASIAPHVDVMKSARLQISTLVRLGQSILLIAALLALALIVADRYQQRAREGMATTPASDGKEPGHYYYVDRRV